MGLKAKAFPGYRSIHKSADVPGACVTHLHDYIQKILEKNEKTMNDDTDIKNNRCKVCVYIVDMEDQLDTGNPPWTGLVAAARTFEAFILAYEYERYLGCVLADYIQQNVSIKSTARQKKIDDRTLVDERSELKSLKATLKAETESKLKPNPGRL